jgi:hypothetical protein
MNAFIHLPFGRKYRLTGFSHLWYCQRRKAEVISAGKGPIARVVGPGAEKEDLNEVDGSGEVVQ